MAKRLHDHSFKIFLIGDAAVGKTRILRKFTVPDESVETTYIQTVGIDFKIKTIKLNGKIIKLQIWDTAGAERFHSITKSFYRQARGIVLVYDITSSSSFYNISKWLRNVREFAAEDVLLMLVGNKGDLEDQRVINTEKGKAAADRINIPFMETSALQNININNVFYDMARRLVEQDEEVNAQQKLNNINDKNNTDNIDLTQNDITYLDKFSCCSQAISYQNWFE